MLHTLCLPAQTIIPSPEKIVQSDGEFQTKKQMNLFIGGTKPDCLEYLQNELLRTSELNQVNGKAEADIRMITDTSLVTEAYRLQITPDYIEIRAAGNEGFFYAMQSLRQLASGQNGTLIFSCLKIEDSPRIGFRSFLLDSGRQYQKVSTIKKYIDMAAMLKMNYFHWHLTEGLGWRIEIKRYPRLTQTGAFVGKGPEQQGFYSQEEIKEVVNYAAGRCITIIPEIDMPGHAEAALVAYPELGCFGDTIEVPENGFTKNIFCAGKTHTLDFLKNVLDEVCELFPSTYIHLGGDEAPKGNWDICPDCRQRIKQYGLKDSHDLQLWFAATMADYLKAKGRKAVFWGDVVYHDGYPLPDNTVIHWWNWRGHKDKALREAVKRDLPVICGTNYYTYLNFPLTPWNGYEEQRTFDIKDVYTANPSYIKDKNSCLLGMSCALWTDHGVREHMIDKRLFPRILAIAEQMWNRNEPVTFEVFYEKVKSHKGWFEKQGYLFGPGLKEEITSDFSWD